MKKGRNWRSIWMALTFGASVTVASALFAACWSDVTVYWDDGSSTDCANFCTFRGGWLCEPR
jgi:hypothetical protein